MALNRLNIILYFSILCTIALPINTFAENAKIIQEPVAQHSRVPNIDLIDEVGHIYNIKDFEGQVVILYFWASWCVDCIKELKQLDDLKEKLLYEDIKDVEIIPISMDFKDTSFLANLYKTAGIKNLGLFVDQKKKIIKALHINGAPTTIILDRNLIEIERHHDFVQWDDAANISNIISLRGGMVKKYQPKADTD